MKGPQEELSVDNIGVFNGAQGADAFGFRDLKRVFWNLEAPALYEQSVAREETMLIKGGALLAETGIHTGRSPKDKFVVRDGDTESQIRWDNNGAITSKARRCSRRTSMAAPTRNSGCGRGSSLNSPGTPCSSATS